MFRHSISINFKQINYTPSRISYYSLNQSKSYFSLINNFFSIKVSQVKTRNMRVKSRDKLEKLKRCTSFSTSPISTSFNYDYDLRKNFINKYQHLVSEPMHNCTLNKYCCLHL